MTIDENPGCLIGLLETVGLVTPRPTRKPVDRPATPPATLQPEPTEKPASRFPYPTTPPDSLQPEPAEKPAPRFPYHPRESILSKAERNFYHVLKTTIGRQYLICPQVPIANLVYAKTGDRTENARYRGKVSCKRVDFVLCHPTTLRPIAAIELDDASHQRPARQQRDAFVDQVFAAAQIPLIRVPARTSYAPAQLRAQLTEAGVPLKT